MKKKIGFIDLHLDEWHANNYPAWLREAPRTDEFEFAYAWEESPNPDGLTGPQWCAKAGVEYIASAEELVTKSDAVLVLAPSNPEVHERLAQIPLQSGKPVYIDKPFAPDRATAERFVALARAHHTPLMSSSALRYGQEVMEQRAAFGLEKIIFAATEGGGGSFDEYGIHQLEMLVLALGVGADRVMRMSLPGDPVITLAVAYPDGRRGTVTYQPGLGFRLLMASREQIRCAPQQSRMFETLLARILDFFATRESPVDTAETLEIAGLLGTAIAAGVRPFQWIPVH